MSNTSRMRSIFRRKTSRALDKLDDPREALDESYDSQVKMLQQVRQGLAEVATAKKRIELQGQEMGMRYQRLAAQAQDALDQGREDLARAALERRSLLKGQVGALREQFTALQQQTARLEDNERRLAERVAAFRIEKETIKATYTASEAQVRANEAAAGIGSQMADVGVNLERARDRVAQMQARAAATDELLASGALQNLTTSPDADLERQLSEVTTQAEIERQLQSMRKSRLTTPGTTTAPRKGPDAWLSIGRADGPAE